MAQFAVTVDDAHVAELFAAFAFVYGYQAEIPNPVPQGTVPDANGFPISDPAWTAMIPNPQSTQAFARARVIDYLKQIVDQARTQQAIAAAQAAAAAGGSVTIT
jgi:hypothetical protein